MLRRGSKRRKIFKFPMELLKKNEQQDKRHGDTYHHDNK